MKKIILFITSICICISLVGCAKNSSTMSNNKFNESKAISMVVKGHPDFPPNQEDTLIKKLPTGGPDSSTVNGKYAKSTWKYKVTHNGVTLLESIDNDYLPNMMK